jgi:hypothetical protein
MMGKTYQLELCHQLKHLVRLRLQKPRLWTQDAQRLLCICRKKSGTSFNSPVFHIHRFFTTETKQKQSATIHVTVMAIVPANEVICPHMILPVHFLLKYNTHVRKLQLTVTVFVSTGVSLPNIPHALLQHQNHYLQATHPKSIPNNQKLY